jgi:hypothetical protein
LGGGRGGIEGGGGVNYDSSGTLSAAGDDQAFSSPVPAKLPSSKSFWKFFSLPPEATLMTQIKNLSDFECSGQLLCNMNFCFPTTQLQCCQHCQDLPASNIL